MAARARDRFLDKSEKINLEGFFMIRVFCLFFILILFSHNSYCSSEHKDKNLQLIISGTDTVIESEGIKFKGFRDLKPLPLMPARTFKMDSKEKTGEKIDCYNLKEIWLSDQFLGRWENGIGLISVYKIKLPIPKNIKFYQEHIVTRNDYKKWLKSAEEAKDAGDPRAWIEFLGDSHIEGEPEVLKTSPVSSITHYKISSSGQKHIDAFIVTDTRTTEHRSFLFVYQFSFFSDVKTNLASVPQSVQTVSFQNVKDVEAKQLGASTSGTLTKNKEYTDEYYETRKKVISGIKNTKGWWFIETPNYIIVSNLKDKKITGDIEKNIEKARTAYKSIFPPAKPISAVSTLKIFNSRSDFLTYVGRNTYSEISITWWDVERNELLISPDFTLKGQEANNRLIDSVFYEAFRQYIYNASGMKQPDYWFMTGCANFFSGLKPMSSGGFEVEPTGRMEFFISAARRKELKVEDILSGQRITSDEENRNSQLMAWGLMYFLFKGAPLLKNKNNYSEIPLNYYNALADNKENKDVTKELWEKIDLKKFNEDFNAFWTTPALFNKSKSFNPFDKNKKKAD